MTQSTNPKYRSRIVFAGGSW